MNLENKDIHVSPENIKAGYIYAPYKIDIRSTQVNGETVWYKNKFKNFLLKIKRFFIKPNYKINNQAIASRYGTKIVNSKFYGKVEINGLEQSNTNK